MDYMIWIDNINALILKSMQQFKISWHFQFEGISVSHVFTYNNMGIVTIYIINQDIMSNAWGSYSRKYNAVGIFQYHALDSFT